MSIRSVVFTPFLLIPALGGCTRPVTVVDARFVDEATVMVEFSEPLSAPGGATPSSFRLSITSAIQLIDPEGRTSASETQYDVVPSPEKKECLTRCQEDEADADCDECDELPPELEIEAVRYGGDLDRIHLELAEPPSMIDCTELELMRSTAIEDAEDRGLDARIELGFMVHYAGEAGALRFDEGRTLDDQGGPWVTERDAEARSSMTLPDDFFSEFDLRETFGCYDGE